MVKLKETQRLRVVAAALALLVGQAAAAPGVLVLQTDFGLKDHAVGAMRGVARLVSPALVVDDLTHEIPAFDIWQAAYRLQAVMAYWPSGTVFVSVVDPGVGSERESVVARLAGGQLIVTPNNGTLTLLNETPGIVAVRRIDEDAYRLPGSADSHTFHGRDLYVHVGALLAAGRVRFENIGEQTEALLLRRALPTIGDSEAAGGIPVLDPQFGNVWTDIPSAQARFTVGQRYDVAITAPDGERRFAGRVPLCKTFAEVAAGEPLLYVNSIGNLAIALNQGDFAARHGISSGLGWRIAIATPKDEP